MCLESEEIDARLDRTTALADTETIRAADSKREPVARLWKASGKARTRRIGPAVVRLRCPHAQACFIRKRAAAGATLGVDPGAKTTGVAVIVDSRVIWSAEITHRSEAITKALSIRKDARSARRCRRKRRTGRHRKESRFGHRTGCKGGLPPSVRHRVQSTRRWIRYVLAYIEAVCAGAPQRLQPRAGTGDVWWHYALKVPSRSMLRFTSHSTRGD